MRVGAQLLIRPAEQQVPGAPNVHGIEGSAVVPLDTFAQSERQFRTVLARRPVRRETGTIDCKLFRGSSCLYMTRLLKTPIIGRRVAYVSSSWIDKLGGLSKLYTVRIPP